MTPPRKPGDLQKPGGIEAHEANSLLGVVKFDSFYRKP